MVDKALKMGYGGGISGLRQPEKDASTKIGTSSSTVSSQNQ